MKFSSYLSLNTLRLATKVNVLMLFKEAAVACCENHTKHKYTLRAERRILVC